MPCTVVAPIAAPLIGCPSHHDALSLHSVVDVCPVALTH